MGLKTILLLGALLICVIFLWESEEAPTQGSSRGRSVSVESPPRAPESSVVSPSVAPLVVDRYPDFPPPPPEVRARSPKPDLPALSPWSVRTWLPAAPKAKPVAPTQAAPLVIQQTSAPVLPKFPYEFLGVMDSPSGEPMIFLKQGDEQLAVKIGDVVGQHWRIEKLGGDRVHILYLPANIETFVARAHVVE